MLSKNMFSILLFLFFSSVGLAQSQFSAICDHLPLPYPGRYCIYLPAETSARDQVLYYMHGLGGNESIWQWEYYYPAQLRKEWKKLNRPLPVVISISFGESWILAEKNASLVSGLFNLVTQKIMPLLETKVHTLTGVPIKQHLLLGESMGAFNSLQLALKTNIFSKVAVICAPLAPISPFASKKEVQVYIQGTYAWNYYQDHSIVETSVNKMIKFGRTFFARPKDWTKSDPLLLALQTKTYPRFYIAAGLIDQFASFEANETLVNHLKASGADVEWHPLFGDHCVVDVSLLAEYFNE